MRVLAISSVFFFVAGSWTASQSPGSAGCGTFADFQQISSVVLAVDCSGSMAGDPLRQAQEAVRSFVNQLLPEDRVGVLSFADDVRIDASIGDRRSSVLDSVDALRADGGTRLYDAIAAAVRMLQTEPGIRFVAAPELNFSPNQVFEFPVEVMDDSVYVRALVFQRQIEDLAGNTRSVGTPSGVPGISDPFDSGETDPFQSVRSRIPNRP